jgi:hypothetical protein
MTGIPQRRLNGGGIPEAGTGITGSTVPNATADTGDKNINVRSSPRIGIGIGIAIGIGVGVVLQIDRDCDPDSGSDILKRPDVEAAAWTNDYSTIPPTRSLAASIPCVSQ